MGQDRGRPKDFLSAGPVAREKDPDSCLYLEPTVGRMRACLEAWSLDSAGGWPLALALGFRVLLCAPSGRGQGTPLRGFSGGADTGDPEGKLVSELQVVRGLPLAFLGLKRWKGHT